MKGFGLIGLLITIAIIGLMVYGTFYYSADQKKNQVQLQQDIVRDANEAAGKQTEYNQSLESEVEATGNAGVNYRAVQDQLK